MSKLPEFNTIVLKDTAFNNMMSNHIYNILIVATRYDSFIMEEDGRIEGQIFDEYTSLGLSSPPRFTQVTTSKEALDELRNHHYDLIIFMPNMDQKDIFSTAMEIKSEYSQIPIVALTPFSREVSKRMAIADTSAIDYIFCWLGDTSLILTIIKLMEDKMNAPKDTEIGAQIILLVEDSIRFYSSALPHLYQYVLEQSFEFAKETLNDHQKHLRMRGRPKIMLARNYQEAVNIFDTYKEHILGIISDMSINFSQNKDQYAGYKFGQYIRKHDKVLPFILESSDEANIKYAQDIDATFIYKNSKQYSSELRHRVSELFGFGDFIIINPQTKEEIMRIQDLKDLQQKIFQIPDESLVYHLSHNHFSRFFYSRAMFPPAEILKYIDVSEYKNMDEARQLIFELIVRYRKLKNTGTIAIYKRERFDKYSNFARIGNGSLGGKGRSLAFLGSMLKRHPDISSENLPLEIPKTVVVCTDVFDKFINDNNLSNIALSNTSDEEILNAFLQPDLPEDFMEDIAAISEVFTGAIAIRSSSLLEDSHYQPFAGVYSTYMVPLIGDKDSIVTNIANAVKAVYASTFFNESKTYMQATGNLVEQEKMSVILQEVVGKVWNNKYFYPNISGVARSLNYYPIGNQVSEDGICDLALGLGKYIVDGGKTLHFSPKHPTQIIQTSVIDSALKDTQSRFYALPLDFNSQFSIDDGYNLKELSLKEAEAHGSLKLISSTYDPQSQMIYDGYYESGRKVLSFVNILQYNTVPLAETLDKLLKTGQKEMGKPVEIEFAVTLDENGKNGVFSVLQIRPIVDTTQALDTNIDEIPDQNCIIKSKNVLGHGKLDDIQHILYIKQENYSPAINESLVEEIRNINAKMCNEHTQYVLIGPGRWGSSDSWLGIPVKWTDISGAITIVEQTTASIDPSQGTHFFHNLTSLGVGYFTINNSTESFIDYDWLTEQNKICESEHLCLVITQQPLTILMDGRHNNGVIQKPCV